MLPVSLDCLSSSCVLNAQCCQCLWIVYLRPVPWMPNVASVFGLFMFALCLECPMLPVSLDCLSSICLECPMLPVSLDCLSSSCALNTQCCQCLWIVYLRPVPWINNVASVFGLFIFVLCLEYPMLPVSLDCLSSSCALNAQCCQCLWIVYLRPVPWMPNVASVSGLFIFVLCLECPMLPVSLDCLSSSCVLNAQCCQCVWIVYLRPVSWMPNVASVFGLFIFVLCLECPMLPVSLDCLSSSCALNAQCCQCLWIVYLRPVPWIPNVASVFGLFISSCSLNTQCCQCLWIVYLRPVPWINNVASVSGLFIFVLCQCPMLPVSLNCLSLSCAMLNVSSVSGLFIFKSCALNAQCCQCLWIVDLRPVPWIPNVASVSGLFIFVLCLE